MADAALARREARRKRILENSHNRLQLISNITNDECCKESPVKSVRTVISEQNNETPVTKIENTPVRNTIYNGVTNNEPISYEPLSDNLQEVFFGEQESTNDSTAFAFPKAEQSMSFFEKFITCKYDLVLLSLLMQILSSFYITTGDNTYFFLPLVLYTTTKYFFFPRQESFKYANILLLLLNGVNSQQTMKLMSVLHWGSTALQDVCIYLFTTICIQSLLIVINNILP